MKETEPLPRVHNARKLKPVRRKLRHRLTTAEATLWLALKNSQQDGRKFRRQHSVGRYVLDFYCPAERLGIELDGQVHFNEQRGKYDGERTQFLKANGIKVIRFENKFVFEEMEYVLAHIKSYFGWWKRS